jgi:hypothetical protein
MKMELDCYVMETLINNEEYRIPGDWNGLWSLQIP